jgi:hypothetical protein
MQGNHMIFELNGTDYTWLECTSQDDPFGFQGNFTDDRDVLVVKPEEVSVHTAIYDDKNNSRKLAKEVIRYQLLRFDRNNRYCLAVLNL